MFESVSARIEIRMGSDVLKDCGTRNDFFGQATAVAHAIKDAQTLAAEKGITAESQLSVVVVERRSRTRTRISDVKRENFYDQAFVGVDPLPFDLAERNLPKPVEKDVWSTKGGAS